MRKRLAGLPLGPGTGMENRIDRHEKSQDVKINRYLGSAWMSNIGYIGRGKKKGFDAILFFQTNPGSLLDVCGLEEVICFPSFGSLRERGSGFLKEAWTG